MGDAVFTEQRHPDLPPPRATVGVVGWLRANLFYSPISTALTLGAFYLLYLIVPPMVDWMLLSAEWQGSSNRDCTGEGACWAMIVRRFGQMMYGFYEPDQRWRVNLAYILLAVAAVPILVDKIPGRTACALFIVFVYPIVAFFLFFGGLGLPVVPTNDWGGLMLTLVLATVAIAVSLPLGILFALGRRSDMPIVRIFCVSFIEIVRAVPLISVLFMASVMLPLFLPVGVNFDLLLRALVGISLFAAAYMAEVIRGGLQAIPAGQYEAAQAMGLSYWKMMGLIILPQALRIVIPGIVNTFIALFKDTTLVSIIGLFDLLGIAKAATSDTNWLGLDKEAYVFAALGFFIFCFSMSRYSIHLERKLHTGHKH